MFTRFPKPLKKNSTIGLVCPAGGFVDYKPIRRVVKYLKGQGYKVKLGKSLVSKDKHFTYLSGSDKSRKRDLINFFLDKSIDAIFCLRGGYGCLRLLDDINFNVIKKNKKIFLGFSDITILLLAIYKKCDFVTFHGPLLGYKFDIGSTNYMWKLLSDPKFSFSYKSRGTTINSGAAIGTLLGGNLTDVCSMIGSRFLPDFNNSIVFLEDCHEEPYKIDRLLTQILNSGILKGAKGFIFSSFYKCGFKNNNQLVKLLKDRISKYNVPAIFNFPIGHDLKNYTVPIGVQVVLDADNLTLKSA